MVNGTTRKKTCKEETRSYSFALAKSQIRADQE